MAVYVAVYFISTLTRQDGQGAKWCEGEFLIRGHGKSWVPVCVCLVKVQVD